MNKTVKYIRLTPWFTMFWYGTDAGTFNIEIRAGRRVIEITFNTWRRTD